MFFNVVLQHALSMYRYSVENKLKKKKKKPKGPRWPWIAHLIF